MTTDKELTKKMGIGFMVIAGLIAFATFILLIAMFLLMQPKGMWCYV